MHPDIMRLMANERQATLREAARRRVRRERPVPAVDMSEIELRLCRCADDPELEHLAALDGRELPAGRFVVAVVGGRIVAALPLAGHGLIADPFVPTKHLERLLEVRATQLREPEPRRRLVPRYVSLIRGSTHA